MDQTLLMHFFLCDMINLNEVTRIRSKSFHDRIKITNVHPPTGIENEKMHNIQTQNSKERESSGEKECGERSHTEERFGEKSCEKM